MVNLVKTSQITQDFIWQVFDTVSTIKAGSNKTLNNKILATLFLEPSTRTRLSFESAMYRLGGNCINLGDKSSLLKGESLIDTIRTVGCYADCIALRSSQEDDAIIASEISSIPVINAGTGTMEHPTQALIDLYTIWKSKHKLYNLNVAIIGDVKARAAASLMSLLSLFNGNNITFISNYDHTSRHIFERSLIESDIIYVTRIQKERHDKELKCSYSIGPEELKLISPKSIIMHPFPRQEELSSCVDSDPRAMYFKQIENGLYIRMALLLETMK